MTTTPRRRSRTRWLLGAVAALAAVAVGGPYAYIHFVEGKAPARLTLSTQTTTTLGTGQTDPATAAAATPTSVGVDGTWNIAKGSVAGYRIKETLFGQSNTAVGRTNTITGSITIAGTQVAAGRFSVDMTTVKSDQSRRDAQFQGRIMDTATYPTATFTLTGPITLGTIPTAGTTMSQTATGNLTMHGTTKTVTFAVQARQTGATLAVSGSIPVVFSDYNITNPSFGAVTTAGDGTLEFLLNFSRA
jgi:polyisoprenoid-binding protein YceI